MEFKSLKMIFKDRFTGKRIGERTFTNESLNMMRGYQHNTFSLWGIREDGKRVSLYGKGGAFEAKDGKIIWHKP